MAWYDKFLKRDGSGITPTPQHFNPVADDYEPLYGRNNAGRVELYGPDGNPISTASNKLAVRAAELEALIGEVQASPTPNTLLARLKNLETKIDAITAGTSPANVKLTGSNVEKAFSDISLITNKWKQASEYSIFGAKWDKSSSSMLTRTDDAVGLVANAGVGFNSVQNDFDKLPIFGEIEDVIDGYGNVFVKIPKFYIRKVDGTNFKIWQVSKRRYPGFYLPWCFWDFTNKKELPYILVGKYKASLSADSKLESKANTYPLIITNIVNFRTYARNNNAEGLLGYQLLDIHAVDLLRTLFIIEFATLDSQSVMRGFTEGQYTSTHLATVAELATNRIIVANAHAGLYRVGQAISVGTTQGGNQIFYGRTITAIDVYDETNKAISFDGDPVDIAVGNVLYNTGWKNGFSGNIVASSGSLIANDGKYPCVYRGIESPFGDVWQFVDGLNINNYQAWIAKDSEDYASNVFASPYEKLGYLNTNTSEYVKEMGFDGNFPFAELPTTVGGSFETYYADYYYQATGQRIALFGGHWNIGLSAGLSSWNLNTASSIAKVSIGGRLVRKAL